MLIDYENEAIFAEQNGLPSTYVIPRQTILIENPIALTKSGASKPAARAFVALPAHAEGAGDLGEERLPAGHQDPDGAS